MRWLGLARRAHEIAAHSATSRTSFGQPLGEHQVVQAMLADSAIDLHAARLLVWDAAWKLDLEAAGPAFWARIRREADGDGSLASGDNGSGRG